VRRIVLTAFALMVLLPSAAFARSEYLCRFDGQIRSSCCCPAKAQKHEAPQPTSLRDVCCCTVIEVAASRAEPTTADRGGDVRSQLAAFIATIPVHLAPPPSVHATAARAPRAVVPFDHGPDLFVRHCAFLL
jgi:hypothetical protein